MKSPYTIEYYARLSQGSGTSATVVVPLVIELVRPTSVIDVGCGTGAWLATFKRFGVADVYGVDGSHIDPAQFELKPSEFLAADLTQPLRIERQFDLALSLEVAEHLPEQVANQFVSSLTTLAPVVLFSAAIPGQGGESHVNEQWPAYWVKRFKAQGFAALDPFRCLLWQRPDVDWWYAQNIVLFVREDQLPKYSLSLPRSAQANDCYNVPPLVHPGNYQQHIWHNRVLQLAVDLATLVPLDETLILVDENRFGTLYLPRRRVLPFLECNGTYAGPPRDDEQAIAELHRMREMGATFIAFGWPSFWWLTFYHKLEAYLEEHHVCISQNDRLVLFALRSQ